MNSAVRTNHIWALFLYQGLKTEAAANHRWSTVGADPNNMLPLDSMRLKKSVHFVKYFPCSCFSA